MRTLTEKETLALRGVEEQANVMQNMALKMNRIGLTVIARTYRQMARDLVNAVRIQREQLRDPDPSLCFPPLQNPLD